MRLIFPSLAAFALSFSCASGMDKKPEIRQPHSVICLPSEQIAVAGENGCSIFHTKTRVLLHEIETEDVFDIAPNKDKTILVLSKDHKVPCTYDIHDHTKKDSEGYMYESAMYFTFSSMHNTIFSYKFSSLFSHNVTDNCTSKFKIPFQISARPLSCHPTKNELLLLSDNGNLLIVEPDRTPLIKTKLFLVECLNPLTTLYAPNGYTIAILNSMNYQRNCFICDLNSPNDQLSAHQFIADDKDYIASAFHPKDSTIALLTTDNIVHLFDYIKHTVIAKTKKLTNCSNMFDTEPHRRLDFDETGKHLAAALKETWMVIDIPQNNLYEIWQVLQCNGLPKEVALPIIANIIALHQQTYEYFNLQALFNVTRVQPANADNNNDKTTEPTTKKKQIKAVYVRLPKNPAIYDDWGRDYYQSPMDKHGLYSA